MEICPAELKAVRMLLDREAIRDVILRYTRGLDREDEELLRAAYQDDGHDDHGSFIGYARDFPARKSATRLRWETYQHYVTNQTIEIDGDTAHAETYFLGALKRPDGALDLTGGRYVDRLEKRDECWAIADRIVIVEWAGGFPPGGAATIPEGLFVKSARDRSDPSYQRPLRVTRPFRDLEA